MNQFFQRVGFSIATISLCSLTSIATTLATAATTSSSPNNAAQLQVGTDVMRVAVENSPPAPGSAGAGVGAESMPPSAAIRRLMTMFSSDIQATLNACRQKNGVNLANGASSNGMVICGNGAPDTAIAYDNYVSTVSDLLAASSLVGLRSIVSENSQVSPEMVVAFLQSSRGNTMLRSAVEMAIDRSQLVTANSKESTAQLATQVIDRLIPTMQTTNNLQTLLGTSDQYQQVVKHFCNAPGMSVRDAQQKVPGLSSVQLYAICVQESGMAEEVQRIVNPGS